jgi:hypothetical protein
VADLEKDPLDKPVVKRPAAAFLRVVESKFQLKH